MKKLGFALIFVLYVTNASGQTINPAAAIMARAVKKAKADAAFLTEHYKVTRQNKLVKQDDPVPTDDPPKLKLDLTDVFGRGRYQYRLLNMIWYQDNVAYVIEFRPAKNQPKSKGTLTEKVTNDVLNKLEGVVYLSKEDYGTMALRATLAEPAGYFYCRVAKAEVTLQSEKKDSVWEPETIDLDIKLKLLFIPFRRKYESTFTYTSK